MKRFAAIFLLSIFMLTALVGCGGDAGTNGAGGDEQGGDSAQTLIFGSTLGTNSLDPAYDYSSWTLVRYGICETLFRLDDDMTPQPWLAESCENINENTWKVTIKEGITFSNGTQVTAQAVADSLTYMAEGSELTPPSIIGATLTADGQELTIESAGPSPTMLNDLADPFCLVVDVHADVDMETAPIGTGPYVVTEFVTKSLCKLTRNETYWDGVASVENVEVRTIMDADTLTMAMQNGEIDWAQGVTAENLSLFADDPNFTISTVPTSRAFIGTLNLDNEHLANPNFRRAIAMAMNKESFCTDLLTGSATKTDAVFPGSLPYGDGKVDGATAFDMDGARALLEQEGYVLENGQLTKNGQRVTMRIISTNSRMEIPLIAEGIASQLMELGIDAQVVNSADDSRVVMSTGEYEIGLMARVTASTGDPYSMLNAYFSTGGSYNLGAYSNSQVDALLADLSAEYDPDTRAQLAIDIQQQVLQDNPVIVFCHLNLSMITKSSVTGVVSHPTDFYQVTNKIQMS